MSILCNISPMFYRDNPSGSSEKFVVEISTIFGICCCKLIFFVLQWDNNDKEVII